MTVGKYTRICAYSSVCHMFEKKLKLLEMVDKQRKILLYAFTRGGFTYG